MTGRLYDRLRAALPPDQLFMDVEGGIAAGADFVDVLRDEISKADVLLVVIGRQWLAIADESGKPRLENPKDFVRIEIQAAIEQQKHIIPVLVGGAAMPSSEQLPDELQPLSRRHAVRLTHERFQADSLAFVEALLGELPRIAATRHERQEKEIREAIEAEQKRAVDDEREHLRAALADARRMLTDAYRTIEFQRATAEASARQLEETLHALDTEKKHNYLLIQINEQLR